MSEKPEEPVAATSAEQQPVEVESKKSEEKNGDANGASQEDETKDSRDDRSRGRDSRSSRRNPRETEKKWKESRRNVKTDFESLPETDDHDEIRKQVEFYFSDSNLAYDDYMRSLVLGNSENVYGENKSIPIKNIHSFKRMRRFQPYSAVLAALKDSKVLNVVGDKEDEIERKVPLEEPKNGDDEFKDPSMPRSIYAKGFGEESRTTQFDIEHFFTPYGPINSVRLRRKFPDRVFKGSVFVEFETEEGKKDFLAIDPKPKFNGRELLIMSKREYCEQKLEEIKAGKITPNSSQIQFKQYYRKNNDDRNGNGRGGRGGRGRGGRGGNRGGRDRDRDDWRGRRDDFQKGGNRDRDNKRRRNRDDDDERGDEDRKADKKENDSAETGVDASKKRSREDDTVDQPTESKKAKADVVEATS